MSSGSGADEVDSRVEQNGQLRSWARTWRRQDGQLSSDIETAIMRSRNPFVAPDGLQAVRRSATAIALLVGVGCTNGTYSGADFAESSANATEADPTTTSGGAETSEASTGAEPPPPASDSETGMPDDDGGIFDLAIPDPPPPRTGCAKVDFLFVIDNSASMEQEQEQLLASFGGFIDTIESTVAAQDYRILVTTTSPPENACVCGGVACFYEDQLIDQCVDLCTNFCGGVGPDAKEPGTCDEATGVGNTESATTGDACDFVGGNNFIVNAEPDLHAAFACAADVPPEGNGDEHQVGAIIGALEETAARGCNPGFVRDDAVLVVTIITDEDETGGLLDGGPQDWHDSIVEAKGGLADAVVMLGLIGDNEVPGGLCDAGLGEGGAQDADTLRTFIGTFADRGLWGSVCAADYAPFFEEAVALVDDACDAFPAG